MNTIPCDVFHASASRSFAFLCADYGFREVERRAVGTECWFTLRTSTVGVRVCYEPGSPIWVELLQLDPQAKSLVALARSTLDMLLDARTGAGGPRQETGPVTEANLEESLSRAAANVRRYGEDVLRGDFGVFPRLRELERENAGRPS